MNGAACSLLAGTPGNLPAFQSSIRPSKRVITARIPSSPAIMSAREARKSATAGQYVLFGDALATGPL
jgi:hypothetical protein